VIALFFLTLLAGPDAGAPSRLRQVVAAGKSGPEVVPLLVQALRQCRRDEPPARANDDESLTAASMMVAMLEERPAAPEVEALVPELLRGLDCADAGVRRSCARGLGRPGLLGAPETAALRRRLATDRRPDGRALAAAILAASKSRDPASVRALERALADRAETVRLASASALLQLERPARARPALERLARSADPQIAAAASALLAR
jgi:HEAT repeat protein